MARRGRGPTPELLAELFELFESLDALEAAAAELRRQKRALFPAIRGHQRAVRRVREIWREARGRAPGPPGLPLLEAAAGRPAADGNGHGDGLAELRGRRAYAAAAAEMEAAATTRQRAPKVVKGRVTRSSRPAGVET